MNAIQISVVIPLFNKEKHIAETIQSVIDQHYPVSEIIVVDDGSTDGGAAWVETCNIHNVRLIKQPNQGVSVARNTGIAAAKFPYIAFLDADDQWLPFFTEEMMHLVQRFPDASAYASRYQCVEPGNVYVDAKIHLDSINPYGMKVNNYFDLASKGDLPFMTSSTMVKKSILDEIGGFPVGEKMGEDQDLFARLALHGYIAYCPNINLLYHRDTQNRACDNNIPDRECGFSHRLHKFAQTANVNKHLCRQILRYTAAHLCHLAKQNLLHHQPQVALRLLLDKRCLRKPKHFFAFTVWALLQQLYLVVVKRTKTSKNASTSQPVRS